MALKTRSIRGTRDVVPADSYRWQYIERAALEVAAGYGMQEIRLPTIEKTELFIKSVGETTDVVQKEMYTFDKGKESITLRPEGTAGTVRAVLENSLLSGVLPAKMCYLLSCFRHENPQSGRLREFHQFGVECFGGPLPSADAEVIGVAHDLFKRLGLKDISLRINSIGCPHCRPEYNRKLVEYFRAREDELCPLCRERLEKNPLRLLDCKNEHCAELAKDAPRTIEHLCEECENHFDGLKKRLDAVGIEYIVDPGIVRGLDYYTKTVFEFVSENAGAQGTVCGGGRYDGLVEYMGGAPTPGLGFGMGLERLLMVMEAQGCEFPEPASCDIYIGSMGEEENIRALALCAALRREGFYALCDTVGRSVKAQMKYADKIGAAYSCILGSQELEQGKVTVKAMETGEATELMLDAQEFSNFLYTRLADDVMKVQNELDGKLDELLGNLPDLEELSELMGMMPGDKA